MTETTTQPPDDLALPPAATGMPPNRRRRSFDWAGLGSLAAVVTALLLLVGFALVAQGTTYPAPGEALEACEHFVEDRLTLPNTAIFGDFDVDRTGSTFTVRGSVDSGTGA